LRCSTQSTIEEVNIQSKQEDPIEPQQN
jgi:hypothetical protein